ncbi:50S ribosomal protein L11 methyltransferase [Muribaculum intestinale]|uniref:50S ribosomal protein L11 methyltransferase n=1 Tax=Muribaculum intestinale TaxID=1796646 RepID=UPI0026EDA82D|nr:50S ribosomal protein L11 methyltransferase [Muribaculum intestinale]
MNDYTEVRLDLNPCTETHTDILAAMLAEAGYESFVPDSTGLTAYIRKEDFSPMALDHVIREFPMDTAISPSHSVVEGQDWNAEWEKNYFKPIVIDNLCAIHSSFHKDVPVCKYDILIDPKMAFGTGHHATTTLILRRLLAMDLSGRKVVDMGTGTGILAILADMRGAAKIDAVEIDEFAYENAKENVKLNNASHIALHHGDASTLATIRDIDLFIANINRNIITADLAAYADTLSPGASVVLSGFYEEDIPVIMKTAETLGLKYADHTVLDRWASLHLKTDEA